MPPRNSPRTALARVLALLGAVLAVLALLSTWASHQLLDTKTYTATSVALLGDPGVRDLTANLLADTVIEQAASPQAQRLLPVPLRNLSGSARTGFERTVRKAADRAVRSSAFAGLWRSSNHVAHREFVRWLAGENTGPDGDSVRLDLQPMLVRTAQLAKIPDAAIQSVVATNPDRGTFAVLLRSDQLVEARSVARRVDRAAWVSTVLAGLLLLASILVAPRKRRALAEAGVALAVAGGVVVLLASQLGPKLVEALDDGGAAQPVARAVWAHTEPALTHTAWLAIAVGIAIAVLGSLTALAGPREPRMPGRPANTPQRQ